jgi:hypothetical protein
MGARTAMTLDRKWKEEPPPSRAPESGAVRRPVLLSSGLPSLMAADAQRPSSGAAPAARTARTRRQSAQRRQRPSAGSGQRQLRATLKRRRAASGQACGVAGRSDGRRGLTFWAGE